MRTTDKRKLNRLIRESFEDGYSNLGQTPIALLGIEDIIDLIRDGIWVSYDELQYDGETGEYVDGYNIYRCDRADRILRLPCHRRI